MSSAVSNIFCGICIGVISGVIASYLFMFYYLHKIKPKIAISKWIVKKDVEGVTNYFFKYVNLTGHRLFDIKVELKVYSPFGDSNGQNLRATDIKLKDDYFQFMEKEDESDQYNLHAMRIRTEENLEELLSPDSAFLGLTITARHSKSGLVKVFNKNYYSVENIKETSFKSGNDLSVI